LKRHRSLYYSADEPPKIERAQDEKDFADRDFDLRQLRRRARAGRARGLGRRRKSVFEHQQSGSVMCPNNGWAKGGGVR
jgi:hypothetical protein